jgi:hypothetical protein
MYMECERGRERFVNKKIIWMWIWIWIYGYGYGYGGRRREGEDLEEASATCSINTARLK